VEYDETTNTSTVANHRVFDSFGNLISETDDSIEHRFAYTGRELDKETGIYYYRKRYYDAFIGRFISEDPIGFSAGDANLSRNVCNNTLNNTDPTGLASLQAWKVHSRLRKANGTYVFTATLTRHSRTGMRLAFGVWVLLTHLTFSERSPIGRESFPTKKCLPKLRRLLPRESTLERNDSASRIRGNSRD